MFKFWSEPPIKLGPKLPLKEKLHKLSICHFDELKKIDITRLFYLFSIVDYDTSGWIIRDALVNNLHRFKVRERIKCPEHKRQELNIY